MMVLVETVGRIMYSVRWRGRPRLNVKLGRHFYMIQVDERIQIVPG